MNQLRSLVRSHVVTLPWDLTKHFPSSWRPPNGHPALEIFLSKVEKDLFDICKKQQTYSNFNSEEWKAMRSLADDRNLVIKTSG